MPPLIEDTCCVCEKRPQFGPGTYPGRPVGQWGRLIICNECERFNWDGIVIATHPRLPGRIRAAGGEFTLNPEGHIVIPLRGSN
jgi:hypothetical protein